MRASGDRSRTRTLRSVSLLWAAEHLSEAFYFVRGVLVAGLFGPTAFGVWASMRIVIRFVPYALIGSLQGVLQLSPKADGIGYTSISTLG